MVVALIFLVIVRRRNATVGNDWDDLSYQGFASQPYSDSYLQPQGDTGSMGPKPTTGPPTATALEPKSSLTNLGPPPSCQGEISDDGYEWVTWQEQWYWREPNTMLWNEFQD